MKSDIYKTQSPLERLSSLTPSIYWIIDNRKVNDYTRRIAWILRPECCEKGVNHVKNCREVEPLVLSLAISSSHISLICNWKMEHSRCNLAIPGLFTSILSNTATKTRVHYLFVCVYGSAIFCLARFGAPFGRRLFHFRGGGMSAQRLDIPDRPPSCYPTEWVHVNAGVSFGNGNDAIHNDFNQPLRQLWLACI